MTATARKMIARPALLRAAQEAFEHGERDEEQQGGRRG
jgi:hypothetical protein